jgi:hypothetical protein
MNSEILGPAAVLVVWTMIMLLWTAGTRFPALKKAGINLGEGRGGRGQDIEPILPAEVNWKSHNFTHLHEQPTIFYATVIIIALTGGGDAQFNVWLAWAYVGLRIVHSLIQALWNFVPVRFLVFLVSSVVLMALTIHAAAAALHL